MHILLSLKLLRLTVKGEIRIQENILLDLDKVTQHISQYPLHHVTCAQATFECAMSRGLGEDAFTRKTLFDLLPWGSRSHETPSGTLYMNYAPVKFEDAIGSMVKGEMHLHENTLLDL